MIAGDPEKVMLRSRIVLNRATYNAEEYEYLREFFSYVVKKQAETIVFKKKAEGK
jgi:tRNA C32,U32 (ribose-2'-O)-methylase TrmJ